MYPLVGTERARNDIAQAFHEYDLRPNIRKMIATRVMPTFPVRLAHGTYPNIPAKQLLKRVDSAGANPVGYAARRAPRGSYHRNDLAFTEASYATEEHGLEGVVDRNEQVHYASHFDHEMETALKTLHDVMLERELRTAAECFSTTRFVPGAANQSQDAGTYQEDLTLGSAVTWSDYANAQPIRDVFVAKMKVFNAFGCYPDAMVVNEQTFRHLRRVDEIRNEWIAQGAGGRAHQRALGDFDHALDGDNANMAASAIAQVLDLEELIVGSTVMDSNTSSDPALAATHVWGNSALVFKKIRGSGGGSLREIGLGHTLQWTPDTNNASVVTPNTHGLANVDGFFVEDYWQPEIRGQVIRVRHQDQQLFKYNIGELITNTY